VAITASTSIDDAQRIVRDWVERNVPQSWRTAADRGGALAIREVRTRDEYRTWYPIYGRSGMVMPTWAPQYGGLGVDSTQARAIHAVLSPYNLGALNAMGLNNTAAALFAYGTEEQRLRFLPRIVRNEERWCQLFSEPASGSDLASLSTRAVLDGDEWKITGQKVWTTSALESDWAILLARTDPARAKHKGLTYFLVELDQAGVDVRPLRQITGEVEFSEVFLDDARVPDSQRLGPIDEGWRVAGATLASERQMVSGTSIGGGTRIGGSGVERIIRLAKARGKWEDASVRQRLVALWSEERIRAWTNARVASDLSAGATPGPAASIGKVHQGSLNQRIQAMAVDVLGADATAWEADLPDGPDSYRRSLPFEVTGMLRSRANTIEGGTSEVNKNILGERVLGLEREPDPWHGKPWNDVPRS
jgi:alkylation response protein AidB-like acyl-CoA dehydrogenase